MAYTADYYSNWIETQIAHGKTEAEAYAYAAEYFGTQLPAPGGQLLPKAGILPKVALASGQELNVVQTQAVEMASFNGIAQITGPIAEAVVPGAELAVAGVTATGVGLWETLKDLFGALWPGQIATVNGVPISGPGVPEPPAGMVAKAWHVKVESNEYGPFQMFYWRLTDGRCMSYHSPTKTWKIWRPKKHIVISSNPRLKNLMKLDRLYRKVTKMVNRYAPKQPRRKAFYQEPYLSPMEKKMLKGGG